MRRTEVVLLMPLLVMAAVAVALWQVVPNTVPVRWYEELPTATADGRTALLFPVGLAVITHAILWFVTRDHTDEFLLGYVRRFLNFALLVFYVDLVTGFWHGPHPSAALGVILFVIGYPLPSLPQNELLRLRTPWTLTSERSWTRSHRVAGAVFMCLGAAMVALGILQVPKALPISLIALVTVSAALALYSYMESRGRRTDPPEASMGASRVNDHRTSGIQLTAHRPVGKRARFTHEVAGVTGGRELASPGWRERTTLTRNGYESEDPACRRRPKVNARVYSRRQTR
jgi:uncharacterized membrane protein